ncbi:splicing factor, proline- and glutamine-rich-like [Calypte anna]|uniref:splicing factor, proline- and glutamine-rich-like n=1 Tax=Calypte anna TaxID=9244 RepID=UPI0011C3D8DA|nr:splicing factor, proline- and glutamine-rich-like [Calypte anna]
MSERQRRGGREGGGLAAERRFLCEVRAAGARRDTTLRGGGAAAGQRRFAAAGRLEVTEFQCRRNGKRAKPKCPRGARPRWGGGLRKPVPSPPPSNLPSTPSPLSPRPPRIPHPPYQAPPGRGVSAAPGLPRSPAGASGRCGFGISAQISLTNHLGFWERWQEEECCQREDKRGMAMPATYG